MENHIQAVRVANAIMLDNSYSGFYLIVEGVKDSKLFNKYINHSNVRIREAFGRVNVEQVLNTLSERGFNRKVGVIDSDFDELLDIKSATPDLVKTDHHDIEVMIFKTKAFDEVLKVFCSVTKIAKFEKDAALSIRDIIMSLAKELGYLKIANKIYNMGLHFRPATSEGNELKYHNFIDEKTLKFKGIKALIETVRNYSNGKSENLVAYDIAEKNLLLQQKIAYDVYHLVNGHDLGNILFLVIKKTFGSPNKMLTSHHSVEDSLLLAFDYDDFKQSKLFKLLTEWADKQKVDFFK
jgi:hypothetical protein